jgi:hypothetical protein
MLMMVSVAAFLVAGCGDEEEARPGPGEYRADFKTSSDFFTNMQASVKGNSPHGTVRIWYSSNVRELIKKDSFTVPEKTVSIKEVDMDSDGTLDAFAVMVKKAPGYDPENNDWYYEMRDAQGTVMMQPPAGKTAMCIQCHSAAKKLDYLAGTGL